MKQLIAVISLLFSQVVFSLDLELTQGINSALPIAVNSFGYDEVGQKLTEVISNDLRFSGHFKLITIPQEGASLSSWKQAGADSIVSGHVSKIAANRYEVSFELLDAVAEAKLLLAKNYQVNAGEVRALAHHISDEIYEKLTGERGVFSTRIAYILVHQNGNSDNTKYYLEVADIDGHNPQSLLVSSEPIMSPSWSPDGQQIAYVSFEKKRAQIFTISVADGKRRLVTNFVGINGAPAWSPDKKQLAVVLSKGGAPKIYSVDLSSGNMKQLTFGDAIDTEPSFSPDGKFLLFTSGRGGTPQVYRLSLADGTISRVTYAGNYNARASYTPDQKHIVMLHREDKNFNISVQSTDNGQIMPLTFSSFAESPSIAPNGRLILYATHENDKGVLGMVSIDGRIKIHLPAREGDVQEPAWSPYLG